MKSFLHTSTLIFTFFIQEICNVICRPHLIVNNDGPSLIGANITFNATLFDYSTKSPLIYIFNDGIQENEYSSSSLSISVSRAFPSDKYIEGRYCMKVTVKQPDILFKVKIAENSTCFDLTRYLVGEIYVYQGNTSNWKDVSEVAIGENFTVVLNLHDPNHYLKDATVDYGWSIDMDQHITLSNSFVYNFTDVGEKLIMAKVTATFPDSSSVYGFFSKMILAKVPVTNVTVLGNPFLYHGDFLLLNVSCNGTPPFEYCSEILKENVTVENFTCHQITIFNRCHMEIKKFLTDGKYQIGIYIGNDVREVKRILEVMVYNVSIKPTLSTVIIPIVCSLLTLIIIALGISYFIQQRNQLAVEVANFDFQDESDSYVGERTFFEKVFDSFTCKTCGRNRLSCTDQRSESDPLLNGESLPYV